MSYKDFLIKISHFFDQIGLRHLERKLKDILFKALGRLFGAKPVDKITDEAIKNILIIRQHNQMGDMLCSTSTGGTLPMTLTEGAASASC